MSNQIRQNHFCSNCGSRVASAENFCRNCGAPLATGKSGFPYEPNSFSSNVKPSIFSFSGRASRGEFWTVLIGSLLGSFVVSFVLMAVIQFRSEVKSSPLVDLFMLGGFVVGLVMMGILSWAVQVRRCHDLGWSGWILLLSFIPHIISGFLISFGSVSDIFHGIGLIFSSVLFIVLGFFDSQPGTNCYGPNPKRQSGNLLQSETWPEPSPQWFLEDLVSIPISGGIDPFSLGRHPVTQAQWKAVMGRNPSWFNGADNPVEQVSWNDCQIFFEKLNALPAVKKSGLVFRLPTEEEWEYACRAGATGPYCKLADGTEITEHSLGRVAWFAVNSDDRTHSVGKKEPNAFGLYDMQGNVWEWTQTMVGEGRVYRGRSWYDSARRCESSSRLRRSPSARFNLLGFRLCASGRAD